MLPAEARTVMAAGRRLYGYFDNGITYLVHDNLTDAGHRVGMLEDGYAILLHEVGMHYGMPTMLGDIFDTVVSEVATAAKHDKGDIGRAAAARKRVPKSTKPEDIDEETLAWLVTDRANHKLSIVRRVWAKIRAFLVRKGFKSAISPDAMVEIAGGAAMRAAGETVNSDAMRGVAMQGQPLFAQQDGKFAASDGPSRIGRITALSAEIVPRCSWP